jgi:hypothetical protein
MNVQNKDSIIINQFRREKEKHSRADLRGTANEKKNGF